MKLINYGAWLACLARLAEIDKIIKKGTLNFKELIDIKVEQQQLRDRFWDITCPEDTND